MSANWELARELFGLDDVAATKPDSKRDKGPMDAPLCRLNSGSADTYVCRPEARACVTTRRR
jgi:hypothetical protein